MGVSSEASDQAYEEAMDDVHTRFILNLPDEELQSAPRIFFQLEQAWWFYDDFICDGAAAAAAAAAKAKAKEGGDGGGGNRKKGKKKKNPPTTEPLPRFKHVKPFSLAMFQLSPLLRPMLPRFEEMYEEFSQYKRAISTYGTILLDDTATRVALCRVYNGKAWTLPGGKVNQNEHGRDAAARETYEETGFDPNAESGASARWTKEVAGASPPKDDAPSDEEDGGSSPGRPALPWAALREEDKLVYVEGDTRKRRTCYVCRGVPLDFPFRPVARKEVAEVAWHELDALPKHTYAVLPFLAQLRRWIKRDNRRREGGGGSNRRSRVGSRGESEGEDEAGLTPFLGGDNAPQEGTSADKGEKSKGDECAPDALTRSCGSKKAKRKNRSRPRTSSRGSAASDRAGSRGRQPQPSLVAADDPLVSSALVAPGEPARWTEDEMFAANKRLLGREIAYDGNPHNFCEPMSVTEKDFAAGTAGTGRGERIDPHRFRVVGGAFMNAADGRQGCDAPPPEHGRLQPLVKVGGDAATEGELALTPFFSDDGRAPWEEESRGALGEGAGVGQPPAGRSNSKGLALLHRLRQGASANEDSGNENDANAGCAPTSGAGAKKGDSRDQQDHWQSAVPAAKSIRTKKAADLFMTDKEITAQSQRKKLAILPLPLSPLPSSVPTPPMAISPAADNHREGEHLTWMKQWVQRLPVAGATPEFGDFRLDADAIVNAMTVSQ